jgi:hypothetical protein
VATAKEGDETKQVEHESDHRGDKSTTCLPDRVLANDNPSHEGSGLRRRLVATWSRRLR